MLTLTRLVGERILIGDDIVIEVRSILDGKQVRISIDAPRQVPIRRAEIVDAVKRANLEAAKNRTDPALLEQSIDQLGEHARRSANLPSPTFALNAQADADSDSKPSDGRQAPAG